MTSQLILCLTLSGKVAEVWQVNFQRETEWQMFTLSEAMLNVNPGQWYAVTLSYQRARLLLTHIPVFVVSRP